MRRFASTTAAALAFAAAARAAFAMAGSGGDNGWAARRQVASNIDSYDTHGEVPPAARPAAYLRAAERALREAAYRAPGLVVGVWTARRA